MWKGLILWRIFLWKYSFFAVSSTGPVPYYDNEGKLQNNVTM